MYLGIDLGTSAVKAVLVDAQQRVVAQQTAALAVSRPQPLWSEQDPASWWTATCDAVDALREASGDALAGVEAIGLSGQMHGATLLDAEDRVLRPAILWNDGRSAAACAELVRRMPEIERVSGNRVMPGFTAPKLVWTAEHEPAVFERVARVLLPKDWLRLKLSGEFASEMSDASGTGWLDVGARAWSDAAREATGLPAGSLPRLVEGSEPTGTLLPELAQRWGMSRDVVIAGGGGDQAAGAVGAGAVRPGDGLLALGTSGVYFVAGDRFAPSPENGVHAFCHALPARWHQMSVTLSAASCLSWVSRLIGVRDEAAALAEVERSEPSSTSSSVPIFLPYLSGERTPHNDPNAKGVFFGMTHETGPAELVYAVLEGVAFALADGQDVVVETGTAIDRVSVIGGGARSVLWGRLLATALDRPLDYVRDAEVGPAFGAARLARLAATGEDPQDTCLPPPTERTIEPDPALTAPLAARRERFRELYRTLRTSFE